MKQSSETLTSLSSVNKAFIEPFPNSKKVYAKGSRDDINVPMRQIQLTDTIGDLAEKNNPTESFKRCYLPKIQWRADPSKLDPKRSVRFLDPPSDIIFYARPHGSNEKVQKGFKTPQNGSKQS